MTQQKEFTYADLRDILINRVGLPADAVATDPTATFDSMGLDSLAFVEIQLALQQQYGFTISDEDAHTINTIGDAIEYTNRRLREQG